MTEQETIAAGKGTHAPIVGHSPFFESPAVTLYRADCMDILPALESDIFDAVVTDPPYSSGGRNQATARNTVAKAADTLCRNNDEWFLGDNMGVDTYIRWMRQIARECLRCVAHGGHSYVFTDWRQFTNLVTAWESVGWTLRSVIVWDKAKGGAMGNFWRNNHEWICVFAKGQPRSPAHRTCFNTWTGAKPHSHAHPTEKPMGLLNYIVGAIPKVSGLLLEPFAGSGTTLLAAAQNGFRAVGMERSKAYAASCRDRLAQGLLPLPNSAATAPAPESALGGPVARRRLRGASVAAKAAAIKMQSKQPHLRRPGAASPAATAPGGVQ